MFTYLRYDGPLKNVIYLFLSHNVPFKNVIYILLESLWALKKE
jgi:hypothetical protein